MLTKIQGILLRTVRHSDSANIVTLFTRQRGRMAMVARLGKTKSARLRAAMLSPLAIVETEVNIRDNGSLPVMGQISAPHPWRNIYFDPDKGAMVFFLTDFLDKLLRSQEEDLPLWNFLARAVHTLDQAEGPVANYHLAFLIRLLPIMGIAPDMDSYREGRHFDMRDGRFVELRPLHTDRVAPSEASLIPLLSRMDFDNFVHFRFNVGQRQRLLGYLMHYYSIHLPVSRELKSLEILSSLFK